MITRQQLKTAVPTIKDVNLDKYWNFLEDSMWKYDISTPERQAAFLSQCLHESGEFSTILENLNYSEMGLLNTFGKYFNSLGTDRKKKAADYARQPEKIANWVYANRMGNGDESSGDGWKYRGRGLIQITGRDMYQQFTDASEEDVVEAPQMLLEPFYAADSACWFWANVKKLNSLADQNTEAAFETITRRINGGTNGWDDRLKKWKALKASFGI